MSDIQPVTPDYVSWDIYCKLAKAACEFVEHREEATDSIWYCNGDKGRALLEALGIPYVEKS